MSNEKKYIITKEVSGNKLRRMALEMAERNYDETQLVLIGIRQNGMVIAGKIAAHLHGNFTGEVIVAALQVDKKLHAAVHIEPAMDFNNKVVILIDDVANSGRTMLYALKPLLETHPKKIQTAALVERTHKSFPVALDYVGLSISTRPNEHIYVEVGNETVSGVWIKTT